MLCVVFYCLVFIYKSHLQDICMDMNKCYV